MNQVPLHQQFSKDFPLEFNNLYELLKQRSAERPNQEFVISPGESEIRRTYQEFIACLPSVRARLSEFGLKPGDRVSLVFSNSVEFLEIYYACLSMGLVAVPINPDLSSQEMAYIIQNSHSRLVVYDQGLGFKVKPITDDPAFGSVSFQSLDRYPNFEWSKDHESSPNYSDPGPDDSVALYHEAVIIYTSGTTGHPKGVVLTHLNFLSDAKALSEWFEFDHQTRTLCILPLFHNNGQVVTFFAPLYQGGSTVIVRGQASLMSFWGLIEKFQVTWTSVMPSILSILLSLPHKRRDQSMKGIICGGQVLSQNVQMDFEERFEIPIFEGFGLTETTSFACFNRYPAQKRQSGTVGVALPCNDIEVHDSEGKPVPPGQEGELCIRGPNVAKEYFDLPERNAKNFSEGWFRSGDFGSIDEDGVIRFQCRKDNLIIKGGENIYPAELENVLFKHPDIEEAAVIGVPDALLGEEICAFVKVRASIGISAKTIREYCSGKIAKFKQAKYIYLLQDLDGLKEIPKGPTKKVLYRELKRYYLENLDSSVEERIRQSG